MMRIVTLITLDEELFDDMIKNYHGHIFIDNVRRTRLSDGKDCYQIANLELEKLRKIINNRKTSYSIVEFREGQPYLIMSRAGSEICLVE